MSVLMEIKCYSCQKVLYKKFITQPRIALKGPHSEYTKFHIEILYNTKYSCLNGWKFDLNYIMNLKKNIIRELEEF